MVKVRRFWIYLNGTDIQYVSYARKGEFSGDSRASGHSIEKNRANLTEMDN